MLVRRLKMNDSQMALVGLFITIWLTEIMYVKVRNGEAVPFWFYGVHSACLAALIYNTLRMLGWVSAK